MNNNDPAAELREKIVSLTQSCPKGLNVDDCPFRMLNEFCRGTKMDTLRQMDYAALLKLFDYSSSCSCPADPRLQSKDSKSGETRTTLKATDLPEA
jgi:hypothetical protein